MKMLEVGLTNLKNAIKLTIKLTPNKKSVEKEPGKLIDEVRAQLLKNNCKL